MSDPCRCDYRGESLQEILSSADFDDVDKLLVIENALWFFKRDAERSQEEVVVLAVMELERQVNNGGFNQFFFNSSGKYAPVIVEGLKRIGCPKTAKIALKAIDLLGSIELSDPDAVQNAACLDEDDEKLSAAYEKLDFKFYEYPEDISGKLMEFIHTSSEKIVLPGPDARYSEAGDGFGRRAGDHHPAPPKYEPKKLPFWKRFFGKG